MIVPSAFQADASDRQFTDPANRGVGMHLPARIERVIKVRSAGVAALWLAVVLLLTACQAQVSRLAPEANMADRQNCHGVHLVNVVAHMDDDLLFIDPRISQVLAAGGCVTSIFMNGGSSGAEERQGQCTTWAEAHIFACAGRERSRWRCAAGRFARPR